MTTKPKQLATAIAAVMAGLGHLPAKMIDAMAETAEVAKGVRTSGYTRQTSPRRVAHDKRAARKLRNRLRARRARRG